MTTAAERLKQLSGLAGVSAATMLLAIGTGATAEELLLSYSGLESGTAAQHLQADGGVVPQPEEHFRPGVVQPLPSKAIKASAVTREGEKAGGVATTVMLAKASDRSSESGAATGKVTVDKARVAKLNNAILWM